MDKMTLTVRDVLSRPAFSNAEVIAGKEGLGRIVNWSHVLEVHEFETLVNGGELILTSGIALQYELPEQLNYMRKLIQLEVACLCIELSERYGAVPQEIIELADAHQFPLILLEHGIRFVDITQDLHTCIINQHHHLLSQLDTLSRRFNEFSLQPNGIFKILQELHSVLQLDVLFVSDEAKCYYYPLEAARFETVVKRVLPAVADDSSSFEADGSLFLFAAVSGFNQLFGAVCLRVEQPAATDFMSLLLDRASLAIAQILLRSRTIEERKQHQEENFVRAAVNGRRVEQESMQAYLPAPRSDIYYRVLTVRLSQAEQQRGQDSWEEVKLQQSMAVRALWKHGGFSPAIAVMKNEMILIAPFTAQKQQEKDDAPFRKLIAQIEQMSGSHYFGSRQFYVGASSVFQNFTELKQAYTEAKYAVKVQQTAGVGYYFYEQLGIYRLLLLIDEQQLAQYAENYLQPLIDYDEQTDSNLAETLQTYFECNCSKKETAERLFIVRQTLYHRLEKIETILGAQFMEPENRLAFEAAVRAKQLLSGR